MENSKKNNIVHKAKKIIKSRKKTEKSISTNLKAPNKLKLLFTIINRSKAEFYLDFLEGFEINMQMVIYGKGTAPNKIEYLNIEHSKAVIISVISQNRQKDIMQGLQKKFDTVKNGKGIAYTIPISSIIGVLIYQYLSNNQEIRKGE